MRWLPGSMPCCSLPSKANWPRRQSGNWLFTAPVAGMRLLNKSTGQEIRYVTQWIAPAKPPAPSGGTTIDIEARGAINAVIAALVSAGIVPAA
jgi:hypothetical protein